MSPSPPRITVAGQRESGTLCMHCSGELRLGDTTALCADCGAVHHQACWNAAGGCCSYQCAAVTGTVGANVGGMLSISSDDLAAANPLPPSSSVTAESLLAESECRPKRWNRTALWAFAVAMLGIPVFGLITGLVAILLACIALVMHTPNRKGLGVAVAAMLIGLFDVIGWTVGLAMYLGGGSPAVSLQELTLDPEALNELPRPIARAMWANVLIQVNGGFGRQGIGSGVVLQVKDGSAKILTNRHVVDPSFSERSKAVSKDLDDFAEMTVMTIGQSTVPGSVEWIAPHGVDLAIVSAPLAPAEVQEAIWSRDANPRIGDKVFAVGNPHGLGWTHSEGSISQVRTRTRGAFKFKVLQSTAAINPGNSGGGLYDADGKLIGINTLTGDKRVAEGLGFSISFTTLLEIVPEWLGVPADHAPSTEEQAEPRAAEQEDAA